MIRILIADDHTLVREGLKQILAASPDMAVKGEAGDGFETLARVREGGWDILLLDMSMPGRSGVDLIRQIRGEAPQLPILVLSMYKEDEYAIRTIRAGAAGYLCKDSASAQLISAIRKVAAGGHFISPEVAGELAYGLIVKDDRAPHESLSDREFQIFRLLAAGEGVVEIALRLNLSPKTVSTYKTRLLQKMEMASVAELVRYGVRHALFEDMPPG
ncbi:response regulator transcription factor [uncultured Propionivibrio sp.]|uniref:response regulator transcription factor n=1 Tax=uncultured Propionivibrio sp. TaxID=426737 RepID=UPI0029C05A76|nr:response regulator transcription factor [uncultured Propionivibrio sp.]